MATTPTYLLAAAALSALLTSLSVLLFTDGGLVAVPLLLLALLTLAGLVLPDEADAGSAPTE